MNQPNPAVAWRAGYRAAINELLGVHRRTDSPAARWAADYLDSQARQVERSMRPGPDGTGIPLTTSPTVINSAQEANPPGYTWTDLADILQALSETCRKPGRILTLPAEQPPPEEPSTPDSRDATQEATA